MPHSNTKTLLEKVKKDYTAIALKFDKTRQEPWEEFEFFSSYLKPHMKLLDLGCGNGRLYNWLKKKKIHYVGMDNNLTLIKIARRRHTHAIFKNGDQLKIPLASHSFDTIWNIAAFHHIPTKTLQFQALKEMRRVLKKDGILVLTVWNLWQKKYQKYIDGAGDALIPFGQVNRYYHAFKPIELRMLIAKSGFAIMDFFCARRDEKTKWRNSYNICCVARRI